MYTDTGLIVHTFLLTLIMNRVRGQSLGYNCYPSPSPSHILYVFQTKWKCAASSLQWTSEAGPRLPTEPGREAEQCQWWAAPTPGPRPVQQELAA